MCDPRESAETAPLATGASAPGEGRQQKLVVRPAAQASRIWGTISSASMAPAPRPPAVFLSGASLLLPRRSALRGVTALGGVNFVFGFRASLREIRLAVSRSKQVSHREAARKTRRFAVSWRFALSSFVFGLRSSLRGDRPRRFAMTDFVSCF